MGFDECNARSKVGFEVLKKKDKIKKKVRIFLSRGIS